MSTGIIVVLLGLSIIISRNNPVGYVVGLTLSNLGLLLLLSVAAQYRPGSIIGFLLFGVLLVFLQLAASIILFSIQFNKHQAEGCDGE